MRLVAISLACALGSCSSGDEYVSPPKPDYPYAVELPELVPVGSKVALRGVEVGTVGADRIVKFVVPDAVEIGSKPGALTFRARSPCGALDMPLVFAESYEYVERSRTAGSDTRIKTRVNTPITERHYVYVDRDGATAAKVSIGGMVLEPPNVAPATGERHALFKLDCPDGMTVKVDDKPVGELPKQLLGNADMSNGPAYYLVSAAKRCYKTTKHAYGIPGMGPSTNELRKGQVHRLPGAIDDWLKPSPKKTTIETSETNVMPMALRRDLVRARC